MSGRPCHLLNLPRELRNEIYRHVFEQRPAVCLPIDKFDHALCQRINPCHKKGVERPIAALRENEASSLGEVPLVICNTPFSQVNRQVQAEHANFLRSVDVDVAAGVQNFDLSRVIEYLNNLSKSAVEHYHVRRDGTSRSKLKLELRGPYDRNWKANLARWIDYVERCVGLDGEFMATHKIVRPLEDQEIPSRLDPAVVLELFNEYQNHRLGAGRLELDKIFYTIFARHRAERMMEGAWVDALGRSC